MSKILFGYILRNYLKLFFISVAVIYSFGIILNLFEEIEFFKNLDVSFFLPLMLTSVNIPSVIIQILPFIIFISSTLFMLKIRNNKDLLTLKVFGFSNIKIFLILAFTSFLIGWIILFAINPITSSLSKYYEKTKSSYSKDIDHLVSFTKNGLWIKENANNLQRIISAKKPSGFELIDVKIFHFNEKMELVEKITSSKVNIATNKWILKNVKVDTLNDGIFSEKNLKEMEIESIYNYKKINSLFKNFDTISFISLITDYEKLLDNGYNKSFLDQALHLNLSLPFFLFLMTALAAIFTMSSLEKTNNFRLIILGLSTCVITFYFKDLSLALGKTDRLPIILAVWSPIIALSFFTFIGVFQINEK